MEEHDVSEAEWRPASGKPGRWGEALQGDVGNERKHAEFPSEGDSDPDAPRTSLPQGTSTVQVGGSSSPAPKVAPKSDSPPPPVQFPASPSLSVQRPPPASSSEKNGSGIHFRGEKTLFFGGAERPFFWV